MKKLTGNQFFQVQLVVVVIVAFLGYSAAAWAALLEPQNPILSWTGDTRTTQTITWQSTGETLDRLQYMEAGVRSDFVGTGVTVAARREPLLVAGENVAVYSAEVTGLKPGTRYRYRIGNGQEWTEMHAFQTAADDVKQFKFLVFGDSQSSLYDTWRTTLQHAFRMHSDAAFFTNVGDLVNVGTDYAEWQKWFAAVKGVAEILPVMPLTGNHEMYTERWKVNAPPILFTTQFQLPRNGPVDLEEQVYSYDYGNVHFVILNSQEREEAEFVPDMLNKQQVWLEQDLSQTDKLWKIVFVHRPPYHTKSAKPNESIRQAFVPLFDKYQVDVVFAGHEHVYARTYPMYNDQIADGTAKGTVYITTGRSGEKVYQDSVANEWDEAFYHPIDQPNYLTVEVRGHRLTVKAWKQDGTLIDEWTATKSVPVRLGIAQ